MSRTRITIISFIVSLILFIVVYLMIGINIFFSAIVAIILYLLVYGLLSDVSPLRTENIDSNELLPYAKELYNSLIIAAHEIKDSEMNYNVQQLVEISRNVINQIEKHPEDTEIARNFISSYLNKVVQLIERYNEIYDKSGNNTVMQNSLEYVKKDIETIVVGFNNEYSKVMRRFVNDTEDLSIELVEQTYSDDLRSKYN